ncbi:twin-arginine translocation signal domain-containing protein [Pontibacter sp. G13]|uniref:twin-arginine translocation signal domain-containing protein n=1 Tax=Pontibacter sp. G13 TaxID=3074898 RepID=UPI002889CDDE|nr:twin-arginine translocation signal domain-containing protein [Pontibacter sp. G13]WNJ17790.1 alkaline phosphatase family protein [Pontibacter sp. G13]
MKRRQFLKAASLATGGLAISPYILPSGRLFAKTMSRKVNHVVFCLFAGGVRNIEALAQAEGNLMPAFQPGTASTIPGLDPIPASPLSSPLSHLGTLYPEFRYAEGPTGHFNGHTVAITGQYTSTGLNLRTNPDFPTIFEYYLKHNSPTVTSKNAWWVSNSLGPYPALNYSKHPGYGPLFGANHIAPTSLLNGQTYPVIGTPKHFQFHEEEMIGNIRGFLNDQFARKAPASASGNVNTSEDAEEIRTFIAELFQKGVNGGFNNPMGVPNQFASNDIFTLTFAEDIIQKFQPELLVVNMTDVDACHQDYTSYCNNLRKADYAVSHLWNTIQQTPGMADDTVLIMVPEHGRNLLPNTVSDAYGRLGIDHTGDPTSREIFCAIIGPDGVVNQHQSVGSASQPIGESIDVVPTIAHILGFDIHIPAGMLPGRVLTEALA